MELKKILSAGACALAFSLASAPAIAQVDTWNTDNAAGLTEDEFRTGLEGSGVFGEWDANDDNALTEDEFNAGIGDNNEAFGERFGEDSYGTWDEDDDNALSEDEFYGGAYAGYDDDESGVIEEPELGDVGDDIGDGGFWDI